MTLKKGEKENVGTRKRKMIIIMSVMVIISKKKISTLVLRF